MVRIMEKNPRTGILQTSPLAVNKESLIARVQQFSNHVYGPMFVAGLHFTQLGDSHFWGHNAIIRIAPFMEHCGLPNLPGKPPLGGEIMSHDFVEAALMRKAGYEVWLAYDLAGSYEEVPPMLLEELKRDRRWCQGNMQHMRLLFARGLFPAHRALFLHGAMAYVSALLWFLFLSLSTAEAIYEAVREPVYFPAGRSLFPQWPVWHPRWALTLLATTAIILFLPKLLSALVIIIKGRAREFSGMVKLLASVFLEVLFSTLFAPVRMMFHSKFVFVTLMGQQVGWGGQQRSDLGTSWGEALRLHGPGTALAFTWGAVLFLINRSFFWWNTPVFIPVLLSIPLSVWSSRAAAGRALRRHGLFVIPEEVSPPPVLQCLEDILQGEKSRSLPRIPEGQGFARAVADPRVNLLHRSLLRTQRKVSPAIANRRRELQEKALAQGPESLSVREKKELLYDPQCLQELHWRVWEAAGQTPAAQWGLASG
jgi:membrane glycosyltransferase